jgi:hypothetical protein
VFPFDYPTEKPQLDLKMLLSIIKELMGKIAEVCLAHKENLQKIRKQQDWNKSKKPLKHPKKPFQSHQNNLYDCSQMFLYDGKIVAFSNPLLQDQVRF